MRRADSTGRTGLSRKFEGSVSVTVGELRRVAVLKIRRGQGTLRRHCEERKRRRFHGEWIATRSEARLELQNHSTWRRRCCSIILPTDRTQFGAIFVSLELSRSNWLITSLSP